MLTRAKSLLIIIGHQRTMQKNKYWKQMIQYCDEHKSVLYGNSPFI